MNRERESGVSKIVGVETETEKDLLDFFKIQFAAEKKGPLDKEHPKELEGLIPDINTQLREFLKKYDIDSVDIPEKNIHIVDQTKLTAQQIETLKEQFEKVNGIYSPENQHIGMLLDYQQGKKLAFLQTLVHEMLHVNSFLSFQKLNPQEGDRGHRVVMRSEDEGEESLFLGLRRMGFRIQSHDGTVYFSDLDEALITELTMRFDRNYFSQIPEVAEEYTQRRQAIERQSHRSGHRTEKLQEQLATIESRQDDDGRWTVTLKAYSYDEERSKLNALIDDLFKKNKSRYPTREDVFDLFAKATLSGRLLPIARLIERTYGRGSFRTMAEKPSNK